MNTQGTVQLYYHGNGQILVNAPSGAKYRPRNRIITIYAADRDYVEGLVDAQGNQLFSTELPSNPEQRIVGTMPMVDAIATAINPATNPAGTGENNTQATEPFNFTVLSGIGPAKDRVLHENGIDTVAQFAVYDSEELAELLSTTVASVDAWKEALRGSH